MRNRILLFFSIFIYFILIFFVEKIVFIQLMPEGANISFEEIAQVIYHGLPLDLSVSGYLTVIPAIFLIFSIWIRPTIITKLSNTYYFIILLVISTIAVVDILVYPYWGFHFDSSALLYLKNPKEVFASATPLDITVAFLGTIVVTAILYLIYYYTIRRALSKLKLPKHGTMGKTCAVLILLTGILFLPIRGGVTVSTMNVGKVYFSENMFLNQAAINPHFNLIYSFKKSEDFASQYQFFDKNEATQIFNDLNSKIVNDSISSDSVMQVLNTERPNIILFILESFSAQVTQDSLIAPNMYQFAKEGVNFNNFYANSFRTDRGLVSILSGYPAHPTIAIMKYPQKTVSLPSIPKSLRNAGYDQSLYYGGDVDFANMRSYFVGCGTISDIQSDKNFPINQRLTKWGVRDGEVLDKVYTDLMTEKHDKPFMKTILTLSSHEPFDVPTHKFSEPYLNSVAYTDSCLGNFVNRLKNTDLWKNTLVIFLADHAIQSYPQGISNYESQRFHIPLTWIGGAVKDTVSINSYGSQNDLAATLLSQLNVPHNDFKFSKDMLNPASKKFAFYSYVNGFSMIDSTGFVIYDNDKNSVLKKQGDSELEKKSKAFFQSMYLDLGTR